MLQLLQNESLNHKMENNLNHINNLKKLLNKDIKLDCFNSMNIICNKCGVFYRLLITECIVGAYICESCDGRRVTKQPIRLDYRCEGMPLE